MVCAEFQVKRKNLQDWLKFLIKHKNHYAEIETDVNDIDDGSCEYSTSLIVRGAKMRQQQTKVRRTCPWRRISSMVGMRQGLMV